MAAKNYQILLETKFGSNLSTNSIILVFPRIKLIYLNLLQYHYLGLKCCRQWDKLHDWSKTTLDWRRFSIATISSPSRKLCFHGPGAGLPPLVWRLNIQEGNFEMNIAKNVTQFQPESLLELVSLIFQAVHKRRFFKFDILQNVRLLRFNSSTFSLCFVVQRVRLLHHVGVFSLLLLTSYIFLHACGS